MTTKARTHVGVLLAGVGILIMLAHLGLHVWQPVRYPLEAGVVAIAFIIGFVGAYLLDPKEAEDGGGFLVNSAVSIIGVVRSGRRATDPIVVQKAVEQATEPGDPVPPLDATDEESGV
jgi:hypothetical protein